MFGVNHEEGRTMETRGIAEGMMVRDLEGKKLGSVIECRPDRFLVEKGLFFPKDYEISYDQVESVAGGEVRVRFAADELGEKGERRERGAEAGYAGTVSATPATAGETQEEVRVPLASEELETAKRERKAGEVRVTKEVTTEEKQVSVPVTREEVYVERTPVEGSPPAGQGAFQEGTISVPVHEEEVEIRKRPVVREEVRVGKVRREGEQRAEAEVRHEEARIDREGDTSTSPIPRDEPEEP
jgi:uncharacterized protein (TIGR02271 family)